MNQLKAREVQALERLFDQQMWALGRDAARSTGNLLLRRGFSRAPPAPGAKTSGTYRLREGALDLELSSLGVRATVEANTVFLDRAPMARVLRGAHPHALASLMRWLASYEAWVDGAAGASWRETTLEERSRPPSLPARQMAAAWQDFAASVEPAPGRADARGGAELER
ncbi:MAG: hypothetical protein IAE78_18035 [Myxococcus sp.]|nr:hypothetical protein [Myxococcus sp.]